MKLTRREIMEGEILPPFLYGLAYEDFYMGVFVFYLMPFNYVVRFFRTLKYHWDKFRSKDHWIDKIVREKIHSEVSRRMSLIIKDNDRTLGVQFKIMEKHFRDELNKIKGEEDE